MRQLFLMSLVVAAPMSSALAQSAKVVPLSQALSEFGTCVVRQAPEKSMALMATALDTPQEYKLARQLAQGNNGCVKKYASLSMRTGQIRGAIAETILVSDAVRMKQFVSAPLATAVRPSISDGRVFVYNYAKCIAAADMPKSAALIQTVHGSPEERQSFLAYGDTLGACMPFNARYTVNIPDIRNHISVALYELTVQAKPKVVTSG